MTPTGYGVQTGRFVPEIAKHRDIAVSTYYGLEGKNIGWRGIPVLPGLGGGSVGNEWLVAHANRVFGGDPKDGIVLTLLDVWTLAPDVVSELNAACWVPVDHEPAPPMVIEFFQRSGAIPIAMSRFGERMLAAFDPLYVPHGVDTSVYRPYPRKETRELADLPEDVFVVGMVAANKGRPSRKGFVQAFQAFRKFRETHDNAILYLHTMFDSRYGFGEDLPGLLNALEIPADAVRKADQYKMLLEPYSDAEMARIYSTMDVLLNPAMGEGFGVPILEAQACGTPGIVSNFSAMPEVCGAGWHVGVRPHWTGQNSWQCVADVDDIVAALEQCYDMTQGERDGLSERAREHSLGYDVATVTDEYWVPVLEELERRFAARKPSAQMPAVTLGRAERRRQERERARAAARQAA